MRRTRWRRGLTAAGPEGTERKLPDRDVPAARALARGPSLETIERVVCAADGVEPTVPRHRARHGNEPRRTAVALARALTTQPLRALGRHFGAVGPAAVSNIAREVAEAPRLSRRLARLLRRCQKQAENE